MRKSFNYVTYAIMTFFSFTIFSCHSSDNIYIENDNSDANEQNLYAKELGLKEVAVNQDANSSEICYFIKENSDTITLIGNKDENGCVADIYMMKYNTSKGNLSTRFDEQMRPVSLTYNNIVDISFNWINDKTAVVKAWDPESNTYITTVWESEKSTQDLMTKSISTHGIHEQREGEMKLIIKNRVSENTLSTRATAVEDIPDQYCLFSVTQCDYPKDAYTRIGLYDAKTQKHLETLEYYKKTSTGKYLYKIPSGSYPSKATNQDLCQKIDLGLELLKTGLTWLAGFSSVADGIALVCASTGLGVPPAAILEALSIATIAGAVSLEIFMDANGTQGLMSNLNPEWYYKEYVVSDIVLYPYVVSSTDIIYCEKQQISPEVTNVFINCDIDGEPTLDSFILDPDYPAAYQGYIAYATYHCVPIGSTITMSIVGTDGYSNSITTTVTTTSGTAELYVPGSYTGVKDVCNVVINSPNGESLKMTASLMFGFNQ